MNVTYLMPGSAASALRAERVTIEPEKTLNFLFFMYPF